MLRLLHAADFHLDSPFSGLTAAQSAQRRRELRQLPARLAELARREGVDLVLLPGDLFDGERVYPETIDALAAALSDMAVPVFIAPGNHDCCGPRSPYLTAKWPENIHIFTSEALTSVELPALNCVVHGCAFTAPHRESDPLAGFSAPADGRLHLLCLHGEVGQSGTYAPIAPQSLERSGAAYAALGHIHACSGLMFAGNTPWAYSGCPEGRGFDECGEKGALLVTLGEEGGPSARFVPTCLRQYRIETLTVPEAAPETALTVENSPDLVRLLLRGERARPLDLAGLQKQWADRFFYLELRDETTLPQDLWVRAEEDSLTGLFLREMRARLERADEAGRPRLLLAARFGLAALERGEDPRP